ncbi:hypothetical protein NUW54_g2177 [Trametes sanguinea]|uniref:Uncharacterized protein n=1 Tax=Trametes sanguinea TaxID=158606 RepID=A0ACC1Q829_9APHY|nr:hypothetical protein NUW54_g2177 [Trametes sanguinea]
MADYLPHVVLLPDVEAAAVRDTLNVCPACHLMCKQRPSPEHVRYRHAHRAGPYIVCVTIVGYHRALARRNGPSCYFVSVTRRIDQQTQVAVIPFGHYPFAVVEMSPAEDVALLGSAVAGAA